jgi:5-methylcytosine-specific restriction endonuclease McrA
MGLVGKATSQRCPFARTRESLPIRFKSRPGQLELHGVSRLSSRYRAALARDGFVCQIRLAACRGRADSVDHIVELEDGGSPYSLSNLQAACRSCNASKRNRSLSQRAKRARVRRRKW